MITRKTLPLSVAVERLNDLISDETRTISHETLRNWIKQGLIQAAKPGKSYLIYEDTFDHILHVNDLMQVYRDADEVRKALREESLDEELIEVEEIPASKKELSEKLDSLEKRTEKIEEVTDSVNWILSQRQNEVQTMKEEVSERITLTKEELKSLFIQLNGHILDQMNDKIKSLENEVFSLRESIDSSAALRETVESLEEQLENANQTIREQMEMEVERTKIIEKLEAEKEEYKSRKISFGEYIRSKFKLNG